jgi:hypothetical protein
MLLEKFAAPSPFFRSLFSSCGLCFQLLAIQQRLKPESKLAICGTTEVVP